MKSNAVLHWDFRKWYSKEVEKYLNLETSDWKLFSVVETLIYGFY